MSPVATLVDTQVKQRVRWGLSHALPVSAIRRAARRGDPHGRVFVAASQPDAGPIHDVVAELRVTGPVVRGRFAAVATSMPAVRQVLTGAEFSSGTFAPDDAGLGRLLRWAAEPGLIGPLNPPSLLVTEPPSHTRYRRLVTKVFSARAVERLRARTQQIADDLLDELAAAGPDAVIDLVPSYAAALPVTVIAEILGVPEADHGVVLDFGTGAAPSLDLGLSWPDFRAVESALRDFDAWLTEHLERLRREPGDDLMSQLVAVRDDESGQGLTLAELKATAGLVLAAGFETTVNLLGNGVALLDQHPEQRELLTRRPELWPNAVDEILRHDPPVLLTGRVATADTEVAGTRMRAGSVVVALLAAANRDPEVFADPDRFDVARPNAREHVSFSAGRHFCLGAALARMEGEVGLRSLLTRFPDLAVAPGAHRRTTRILRGYRTLPVRLSR